MWKVDKKGGIHVPPACEPWSNDLLTAYYEARGLADRLAEGFWEKYSLPDAAALLCELKKAACSEGPLSRPDRDIKMLETYRRDLTRALAAFYWLTVPATEHVALEGKEVLF